MGMVRIQDDPRSMVPTVGQTELAHTSPLTIRSPYVLMVISWENVESNMPDIEFNKADCDQWHGKAIL
jgi:hypothetical protein